MNIYDKNALVSIIDNLDEDSAFYAWGKSGWDEEFYYEHYCNILKYVNDTLNADLYQGCYKVAIVFHNIDLVWKIPFCNTNDAIIEYNFYRHLNEEWKFYFAECDCLGKIRIGKTITDIIVMEQVNVDEDKANEYVINGIKKQLMLSSNTCDNENDKNLEKLAYDTYCTLRTEDSFSYLMYNYYEDYDIADYITYELGVIDCHEENIGFIGDRPIIIDYAMNSNIS